jgi:hypothetical protein
MKKPLTWIPLWIDSWLYGSTRIELTLEQRAIFVDLLALAGKDEGFIRANVEIPYPIEQLAGLIAVSPDLLSRTIERCIETGKIERLPNGTLRIVNWERFKLTRQYRHRLENPSPLPSPLDHPSSLSEEEKTSEHRRVKGNVNDVSRSVNSVDKNVNTQDQESSFDRELRESLSPKESQK